MTKLFGAHAADAQKPSQRVIEIRLADYASHQVVAVNIKHDFSKYMDKQDEIRREAHEKLDALLDRVLPV